MLVLGLLMIAARVFVYHLYYIPSGAMQPTLQVNDRLIVNRAAYWAEAPRAGDVIVFAAPPQAMGGDHRKKDFIKRIVGIPGDTILVKGGKLYRNGQAVSEPYIQEPMNYAWPQDNALVLEEGGTPQTFTPTSGLQVPPGYLFVLGDNRNDSNDGHRWEARGNDGMFYMAPLLPAASVRGRAVYIYSPPSRARSLR